MTYIDNRLINWMNEKGLSDMYRPPSDSFLDEHIMEEIDLDDFIITNK